MYVGKGPSTLRLFVSAGIIAVIIPWQVDILIIQNFAILDAYSQMKAEV